MANQPLSVKAVFDDVLGFATPAERQAYLDRVCADAPDVHRQVEALLQAYADAGSFLEKPLDVEATVDARSAPPEQSDVATLPPPGAAADQGTMPPSGSNPTATMTAQTSVPGFEILGELGRGGMGVVYKARQTKLNRIVALKMILAGGHAGTAQLERFRTEAEAIARLQHPNIVQIHEVGEHDGLPFFALEFCAGGSLEKKLAGTPLPAKEAAALVEKLARAMHAVHEKGVIHRDLKPANVLLAEDGTPKITDFGLAKKLKDVGQTATGAIMGTPSYMAPEQAGGGAKELGPPADLYALGVILYECLTGRPPFRAATALDTLMQVVADEPVPPSQLQNKTPRDLETICLKCLAKEPGKRYVSAQALADDLARYQSGAPIQARPVGNIERVVKWVKRRPMVAGLIAAVAVVAFVGLAAFAWAFGETVDARDDAREQAGVAKENTKLAEQRLREANRVSAQMAILQGLRLCADEHEGHKGLLWLVRGLELAQEAQDADLERAIRRNLGEWSRVLPRLRWSLPHPQPVLAVAVSPDGRILATGCEDHKVRFWDRATGKLLEQSFNAASPVAALAYDPDGRFLVTGCKNGSGRIWDLAESRPVGRVLKHDLAIHGVAVSPDGARILTAGADKSVRLWDAVTGDSVGPPFPHGGLAKTVAFHPTGKSFVVGSYEMATRVWDTFNMRPLRTLINKQMAGGAAFSPDGAKIGVILGDGAAFWNAASGLPWGKELTKLTGQGILFSPSGQQVLTWSRGGKVNLWDESTLTPASPTLLHQGVVNQAVFTPDGQAVVTAGSDNTLRVWTLGAPKAPRFVARHDALASSVIFSADGKMLVSGGVDGAVRFWDTVTGNPVHKPYFFPSRILAVALSPDQKLLLAGGDGVSHLVNIAERKAHAPPMQQPNSVWSARFSPDGRLFAGGTWSPFARIGATASGKPTGIQLQQGDLLFAVAFRPDSRAILTGATDGQVQVWDAATGKLLQKSPRLHRDAIHDLRLSKNGALLLTASFDHTAHLWDAQTFAPVGQPFLHQGSLRSAALSADASLVVTGSEDGTARVWDAATGKPVGPALVLGHPVWGVDFHPSANLAAIACFDGTVSVWEVAPPIEGDLERVRLWAETFTGVKLEANGAFTILDQPAHEARRLRLEELGGLPPLPDPIQVVQPGPPADGYAGFVERIHDGKIKFRRRHPVLPNRWESLSLPLDPACAVKKARLDPDSKKIVVGADLPGGFQNPVFADDLTSNALGTRILTDASGKKVVAVHLLSQAYSAAMNKMENGLVTLRRGKWEKTLEVAKDCKVFQEPLDIETSNTPNKQLPGGLSNPVFQDLGQRPASVRVLTDADGTVVHEISVSFLAGPNFPPAFPVPQPAKGDIILSEKGNLADQDPLDKILNKSVHKVHVLKMSPGFLYTIDLKSQQFDAFLRLENAKGVHFAADDDSGGGLDAQLVFRPQVEEAYRIIATTFQPGQTGGYTLTVRRLPIAGPPPKVAGKVVFTQVNKLDAKDPPDRVRKGSPHKVHAFKMIAGQTYTIDLVSDEFDPYLRLEDAAGKQLAQDDDGGGNLNARLVFRPERDEEYRFIVTTYRPGAVGGYTLTIRQAEKK